MSRYVDPVCSVCRREGTKLFLKGDKCYTKCVFDHRAVAPGQHGGRRRSKPSEYSKRLREKQLAKRMVGITERQFRRYFRAASRSAGQTGATLLRLLETRLDHVVRRMGFTTSQAHARQLITHGHVFLNQRRVTIPSHAVRPGDEVRLSEKLSANAQVQQAQAAAAKREVRPSWLEVDAQQGVGRVKAWPRREEMSFPVNEQLIVELYSK
ncbi:MAG: 30S ribosomal protein S4 [Elusimicrobia bacterium]|nr:30S ribosomal protein S4 [Elusimicrobiota bacterium]